jgi:hypothetical protein
MTPVISHKREKETESGKSPDSAARSIRRTEINSRKKKFLGGESKIWLT